MPSAREHLDSTFFSQAFPREESSSPLHLETVAAAYAFAEQGIAVLSDLREKRSIIFYGSLGDTLGIAPSGAVHEVAVRAKLLLVALLHAAQVVLEALLLCPLLLDLLRGVVYLRLCRVNLSRLRQYDFFVVALHILAMHKKRAVLFEPLLYVAQIGLGVCPELGCLPNLAHGAKAACDGPAGASRGACRVVARA
jgi:hypothetical protein